MPPMGRANLGSHRANVGTAYVHCLSSTFLEKRTTCNHLRRSSSVNISLAGTHCEPPRAVHVLLLATPDATLMSINTLFLAPSE